MTDLTGYAAACERAATNQGLDPLTALLNRHGIPHVVEQTGGFTMVVRVTIGDAGDGDRSSDGPGGHICINADGAPWLACFYPQDEWYQAGDSTDDRELSDSALIEMIRFYQAVYARAAADHDRKGTCG